MKRVLVLMSTYNGAELIIRQVDSIMNQTGVDITVYIRDDGSSEKTVKVLHGIKEKYQDKVKICYGNNIGWKRSFIELLYTAEKGFDYYAFSDQDDIWFKEKVIKCIRIMEADRKRCPKLTHCNALSVDEKLNKRKEQEKKIPVPTNFKSAIATEYFQGCSMIWNDKAMTCIREYKPLNLQLAHDYWVGLICYFFGKIYFVNTPLFYHIRYESNSSADGNKHIGRMKRFKEFIGNKGAYMNPASDLINGYAHKFKKKDINKFLYRIERYKNNLWDKFLLIFDYNFRRPSKMSTILFKLNILLNRF